MHTGEVQTHSKHSTLHSVMQRHTRSFKTSVTLFKSTHFFTDANAKINAAHSSVTDSSSIGCRCRYYWHLLNTELGPRRLIARPLSQKTQIHTYLRRLEGRCQSRKTHGPTADIPTLHSGRQQYPSVPRVGRSERYRIARVVLVPLRGSSPWRCTLPKVRQYSHTAEKLSYPGDKVFTLMPAPAISMARLRAKDNTAPLLLAYAESRWPGHTWRAA